MSNVHHFTRVFENAPAWMTRKSVHEVSGGLVAVSSLATYDCQGRGIKGKRLIGKKACYPKNEVFQWLMAYMGENLEAQEA